MSHAWCVGVLDSISCIKSLCLHLITRVAFFSILGWNELKCLTAMNQNWSYLQFLQKNTIIYTSWTFSLEIYPIMFWFSIWSNLAKISSPYVTPYVNTVFALAVNYFLVHKPRNVSHNSEFKCALNSLWPISMQVIANLSTVQWVFRLLNSMQSVSG